MMSCNAVGSTLYAVLLAALLGIVYCSLPETYCRYIPNCLTCNETDSTGRPICSRCNEQLFFLKDDPEPGDMLVCRNCSELSGCLSCYTRQRCIRCRNPWPPGSGVMNGPDLNSENGTCSPCASFCYFCNASGSGKCDVCKPGYYVGPDGYCEACKMDNCAVCTSNGTICHSCLIGKISSAKSCDCALNCATCSVNGYGFCDQCNPGYQLNADNTCS